jgi:hypothetical protein
MRIGSTNESNTDLLSTPIPHILNTIMFSLGLSKIFSKVLAQRGRSLDSEATRSSLPDSFDVGLTHDWSDDSSTTNSNKWCGVFLLRSFNYAHFLTNQDDSFTYFAYSPQLPLECQPASQERSGA